MLANRTTSAPPAPAPRRLSAQRVAALRSKTTNDPLSRFSLNTAEGRRARDLFEGYVALMGAPTDTILLSHALAAAELVAASEMARAEFLLGRGDIGQVIRLENLAARSVRRLGIKPATSAPPSLKDHLRQRAAERAGATFGHPA
jgi:hypothetical protein